MFGKVKHAWEYRLYSDRYMKWRFYIRRPLCLLGWHDYIVDFYFSGDSLQVSTWCPICNKVKEHIAQEKMTDGSGII